MLRGKLTEEKLITLWAYHAMHPRPEAVTDDMFVADSPFFDARDLVQVKYEMLRRVHKDGQTVTQPATSFGFSRPSFYQTNAAFETGGLPGLLPQRWGLRQGHKVTPEVLAFMEQALKKEPTLRSRELAQRVQERFGVSVHPRSIERGPVRRKKPLEQKS
jgi:transposase